MKRPRGVLGLGLALAFVARRGEAASPVDVRFVSTAGCGSSGEFLASFAGRAEGVLLRASEAPSPVEVELVGDAERTVARLAIRLEDGSVVERSLTAQSCVEALEAIAFVTALALDPEAVARPPKREDAAPESAPPPERRTEKEARPAAVPESNGFALRVGPVFSGSLGVTPSVLLGGGLGLEVGREGAGFVPWLRVTGTHERTEDAVTTVGRAAFERTLANVELCAVRLGAGDLAARLCAHLALGHLLAEGRETNEAEQVSRVWGAAGGATLVEWRFAPGFVWSTSFSAGAPWTRGAYRFDDDVFFETSAVVGSGSTGLFLEFR